MFDRLAVNKKPAKASKAAAKDPNNRRGLPVPSSSSCNQSSSSFWGKKPKLSQKTRNHLPTRSSSRPSAERSSKAITVCSLDWQSFSCSSCTIQTKLSKRWHRFSKRQHLGKAQDFISGTKAVSSQARHLITSSPSRQSWRFDLADQNLRTRLTLPTRRLCLLYSDLVW